MSKTVTKAKKTAAKATGAKKAVTLSARVQPKSKLMRPDLPVAALVCELLGTVILTSAVLVTSGNALVTAMTLLVLVVVFGAISGGYFNPAVTVGLLVVRRLTAWRALGYIIAQFLGAMLAMVIITKFINTGTPLTDSNGMPLTHAFAAHLPDGHWEQFFAEAMGAVVLGLGIGAITFGKKSGLESGFAAGLSLFIGLVLATLGSAAILNPAVALGVSAYAPNVWAWLAYAAGPVVGVSLGVVTFKLLQKHADKVAA